MGGNRLSVLFVWCEADAALDRLVIRVLQDDCIETVMYDVVTLIFNNPIAGIK